MIVRLSLIEHMFLRFVLLTPRKPSASKYTLMTKTERYRTDKEYRERIQKQNRERYRTDKEYRERNKEKLRERRESAEYRQRESAAKAIHASLPSSKAAKQARNAKRRRTLRENITLTDTELAEVNDFYALNIQLNEAARGAGDRSRTRAGGMRYAFAVDHLLPLLPAKVEFMGILQRPFIGLHVSWNLSILQASNNLQKKNRY